MFSLPVSNCPVFPDSSNGDILSLVHVIIGLMKYMGSKNRIAKDILPIMLKCRSPEMAWVEPFVGGANIIDKVEGTRIGSDINPYLIQALISIRDYVDDLPKNSKEFTENDYRNLKLDDSYKHKGYAGFAFSYGGKWLGGWSRNSSGKRDYVAESYRNAMKQSPNLQGINFRVCSYLELEVPANSLIYCDPPYFGTTSYKNKFDSAKFWDWCRAKKQEGHTVFVSEYTAPDDFQCVWEKEIVSSLTKNTGAKKGVEKLFTL